MPFFHAKGWWPKSSCPPSKVCLPWVSKRGIWDVPRILPGCPGPLGVFKKFVQKKFVRIFRSLYSCRSKFVSEDTCEKNINKKSLFRSFWKPQPLAVSQYHSRQNHYSQFSDFSELISITVTVTVIIFSGINYKTVMW